MISLIVATLAIMINNYVLALKLVLISRQSLFFMYHLFPRGLDGRPRLPFVFLRFFRWLFPIVSGLRLSFCGLFVLISNTR